MGRPLFTLGHGTAPADTLAALLRDAEVRQLVDVRAAPGSRRNPGANRGLLQELLPTLGIGYRWEKRLGGWRRPPPDSPDTALRNQAFAGYAAHMRTPTFVSAMEELLAAAANTPTAVMCSESLWWRCHRRMIADFAVLASGVAVVHLMHDGRHQPHRLTEGVRRNADGLLIYDGGQGSLQLFDRLRPPSRY